MGAIVGSGAGSGGLAARSGPGPRGPPRGGLGPPRGDAEHLVSWTKPVPILMYHVIASPPATAQLPELFVDPKTFTAQMEWLERQGYAAVSLNQVYDAWFKGGKLPDKPVVLTFDDGYRGDYVYARPTLRRLRWPGDLNLLVKNLGPRAQRPDGRAADRRRLGDRRPYDQPPRPDDADGQQPPAGGGRVAPDPQRALPPAGQFLLLPGGSGSTRSTIRAVRRAGYLGATTELPGDASRGPRCTSSTASAWTAPTASAGWSANSGRQGRSYLCFLHFFAAWAERCLCVLHFFFDGEGAAGVVGVGGCRSSATARHAWHLGRTHGVRAGGRGGQREVGRAVVRVVAGLEHGRAARSDRAAQGHAGDQRGGGSTGGGPVVRHQDVSALKLPQETQSANPGSLR